MASGNSLAGTKVLLCVTGSVAGIKVGELLAHLQRAGADCRVAASQKGSVFLDHSQHNLPANVKVYHDDSEADHVV